MFFALSKSLVTGGPRQRNTAAHQQDHAAWTGSDGEAAAGVGLGGYSHRPVSVLPVVFYRD